MVVATPAAPTFSVTRPLILQAVVEGGTDLFTPVTDDFTTELEKELEKARTAADRSPSINGKTDTSQVENANPAGSDDSPVEPEVDRRFAGLVPPKGTARTQASQGDASTVDRADPEEARDGRIGELYGKTCFTPSKPVQQASGGGDEMPGEASSLAADVETDIRDVLGSVISKDTPRFDGLVRVLGNADFEARCDKAGVKGTVNAFIETDDKGEVLGIWIRKGSDNRQTLIHELLHAYVSSAFKSVGQSFEVRSGEAYSNLSEGAVDFIVSLFMDRTKWHAVYEQESVIAEGIYNKMGAKAFYAAVFGGDKGALEMFREQARAVEGIIVNPEKAPNTVEASVNLSDGRSEIPQGDIKAAQEALKQYGGPELFGKSTVEPLSPTQDAVRDWVTRELGPGGLATRWAGHPLGSAPESEAALIQPEVIAAIEQVVARQPQQQRDSTLEALRQLTFLNESDSGPFTNVAKIIGNNPTDEQAQAVASAVVNLAPLSPDERKAVFAIDRRLMAVHYRSNSPFISPEIRAWIISDVASLSPEDRVYFRTRVDDLYTRGQGDAQWNELSTLFRTEAVQEGYNAPVKARVLTSQIWMQDQSRSTAREQIYKIADVEYEARPDAKWNPPVEPLTPSERLQLSESMLQLLEILDDERVPDQLRNYAPTASSFSPLDMVTSSVISGGSQLLHVPDSANAAAQAIVERVRWQAIWAIQRGDGSDKEPLKLRVLMPAGSNADGGRPLTDGPPAAGALGYDLLKLNEGPIEILYRGERHQVQLDVEVRYVVDPLHLPVQAAVNPIYDVSAPIRTFDCQPDEAAAAAAELVNEFKPDIVISTGVPSNSPLAAVLAEADTRDNILTIAIGDSPAVAGMRDAAYGLPNVDSSATEVGATYPVPGNSSTIAAQALGGAVLAKFARPDELHTARQLVDSILAAGAAGAVDGVSLLPPGVLGADGLQAGVKGLSILANAGQYYELVEALRHSQPHVPGSTADTAVREAVDLVGFDSSMGGAMAMAFIAAYIMQETGIPIRPVLGSDQGNASYGVGKSVEKVASLTNASLRTLDKLAEAAFPFVAIIMVCNTACGSGKPNYAVGINAAVFDLIEVTSEAVVAGLDQDPNPVILATKGAVESHAYQKTIQQLTAHRPEGPFTPLEVDGGESDKGADDDWAAIVNKAQRYLRDDATDEDKAFVDEAIRRVINNVPQDATSVWLCCTHYPALESRIRAELDRQGKGHVRIVNPMIFQAQRVLAQMRREGLLPPEGAPAPRLGTDYLPPPVVLTTYRDPVEVRREARAWFGRSHVRVIRVPQFGDISVLPFLGPANASSPQDPRELLNGWHALDNLHRKDNVLEQRKFYDRTLSAMVPVEDLDTLRSLLPVSDAPPIAAQDSPPAPEAPPAAQVESPRTGRGSPPGAPATNTRAGNFIGVGVYGDPTDQFGVTGLFRHSTPIRLDGEALQYSEDAIWLRVSGTVMGGRLLEGGWAHVKDIRRITIAAPAGTALYSDPRLPFTPEILAQGVRFTPTGNFQVDSGRVFVEVNGTNEHGAAVTGWLDGGTINRGHGVSGGNRTPLI